MIKYLEIADFHFSTQWAETSVSAARAIRDAAKDVDFIAIVGDFFDAPIYASDRGGMRIAKKIIKSWTDICPVVAVEGTPSHDAPGCYGLFDDVLLLEPGKVYGYYPDRFVKSQKRYNVREIDKEEGLEAILFGIPELSKKNIHANLNLSGEEANAEAVNLLKQYILDFVAPMRLKYKDIPAVGLLHGNVSDSERSNETDIILKSSDIVIYTEDLEPANVDRWSLGHIHTPWESKKINCGYAGFTGMDKNPWGKRDFVPAMNLVTDGKISRIPYGTPERRKVNKWKDCLESTAAYWLETSDPDALLPPNVHPWSRITYSETKTKTRRVTEEEAASVKSLWDLFKLVDPTVSPDLKPKVDLITETIKHTPPGKKDVRILSVKIKGSILFKGKTIELDITKIPEGLNLITGENGSGKSSLLSFCHPFPLVIGKDKGKTLKTFFSGKDSSIEKRLTLNRKEHHHKITIKAAHTQTPKTECYLTIDNAPQLDKGTFDEMMELCETLYGSVLDYRITSFCEQPQQAVSNLSGLMSAKPVDARNLVQTIAGVDREAEKRFALDRVAEEETRIRETQIKVDTLKENLADPKELINNKTIAADLLLTHEKNLKEITETGKADAGKLTDLQKIQDRNKEYIQLQKNLDIQIGGARVEINDKYNNIEELKNLVKKLPELKKNLDDNKEAVKVNAEIDAAEKFNSTIKISYMELESSYNEALKVTNECARKFDNIIRESESVISKNQEIINLKNQPCEHCGKLPSDAAKDIEMLERDIEEYKILMEEAKISKEALIYPDAPTEPEYKTIQISPHALTGFELDSINDDIKKAENAQSDIDRLGLEITSIEDHILLYQKQLAEIIIDTEIDQQVNQLDNKITADRKDYSDTLVSIEKYKGEIKAIEDQISNIQQQQKNIKELEASLNTANIDAWKYIAKMLGSDKIPALELDMVLSSIDAEATRNIEPFLEARYSFRTTTQEKGIDRFDIFITDLETGEEDSLFIKNPGHKAFFSDAYIKSLIRQRNQRIDRSYSPIIFDESDAPIKENWIPMYYDINQKYFEKDNAKVLVVSQKDSAVNYMSNVIEIETLKEK